MPHREPDIVVDGLPVAAHISFGPESAIERDELRTRVREALAEGHTTIVVSGLTHPDSGQLAALFDLLDEPDHRGAKLVICGTTGRLKVVIDMLGLSDFLMITFVASIDEFIDKWRRRDL